MRSGGKAQEEAESCAWRNSRWEMYGLHTAEGPGPLWTAPDAGLPGSPGFLCPCAAPISAHPRSHMWILIHTYSQTQLQWGSSLRVEPQGHGGRRVLGRG